MNEIHHHITESKPLKDTTSAIAGNFQSLIHFLDSEIEFIKDRRQQPGWTKWAINGSLATSFWLLLNELEKTKIPSLITIIQCLILFSLLSDLIFSLRNILLESESNYEVTGRFFISNQLAKSRLTLVLIFIRYIFILLFINLSNYTFLGASLVGYIINGWFAFAYFIALVLSFLNIPIPNKMKQTGSKINFLLIITMFATGYTTSLYLYNLFGQPEIITGIRIGGLVATIYYLLILISKISIKSPLMESLVNIRRELSLGHLEYQTAVEQVDIVVAGLKISDVLQEYVGNIVTLFDEFNSRVQKISICLNAIEKINSEAPDNPSDEQKATIEILVSSVESTLLEAKEIVGTKIPSALKPFNWRMETMKRFSDIPSDEIENVMGTIRTAGDNAENQMQELFAKAKKILE